MTLLAAAAAASAHAQNPPPEPLSFVAAADTTVRKEPSPTAPVAVTLKMLSVCDVVDGGPPTWIQINCGNRGRGWITVTEQTFEDYIIRRKFFETMTISYRLEEQAWPVATKLKILQGRIAIGFTQVQVVMALGEPTSVLEETTADGATQVLTYRGTQVEIRAGKVAKITTVK
jgi:hypothetical protein